MQKILILCSVLMMSSSVFAQETPAETCADGAGVVAIGAVTGYEYCMSKYGMNWWNAHAWCDAQNRSLFSMDDCQKDGTTKSGCPEMVLNSTGVVPYYTLSATPKDASNAYPIRLSDGSITGDGYGTARSANGFRAMCK